MEIIKLNESHLESVSELFINNYKKTREKQFLLSVKYTDKDIVLSLFYDLYEKATGFVAVDNNDVIGYLIGIPIPNFKGTQGGIYCPEWAHAAIGKDRMEVYQRLYDKASAAWVENKYLNHAITILAGDDEVMNMWFWNGFGIHVVDAVRDLKLLAGRINGEIEIRKFKKDDIEGVLELLLEYKKYMSSSPIFLPLLHVDTEESIYQWLEKANNTIWLAVREEKIISMMEVSYKKSNDAQILSDDNTVSIGITYTRKSFRGQGVTKALLQSAINEASLNGYERCAVVFESQNSYGRQFWLKYFEPVCFSLVRKVDDRIIRVN